MNIGKSVGDRNITQGFQVETQEGHIDTEENIVTFVGQKKTWLLITKTLTRMTTDWKTLSHYVLDVTIEFIAILGGKKMKKEETIKAILEKLINQRNQIGYYSKDDIEKAIIQVRGADYRTLKTWFTVLWRLEYLLQPQPNIFHLNLAKISELELSGKLPRQIDTKQRKLGAYS